MELHEFLGARIAEDEEIAKAALDLHDSGKWQVMEAFRFGAMVVIGEPSEPMGDWDNEPTYMNNLHGDFYQDEADHIARFDPARILAECAAKRMVIEMHAVDESPWGEVICEACGGFDSDLTFYPCPTLYAFAAPYSYHPDFNTDWAV